MTDGPTATSEHALSQEPLPIGIKLSGTVRRCVCGWVSVGPKAEAAYQQHVVQARLGTR